MPDLTTSGAEVGGGQGPSSCTLPRDWAKSGERPSPHSREDEVRPSSKLTPGKLPGGLNGQGLPHVSTAGQSTSAHPPSPPLPRAPRKGGEEGTPALRWGWGADRGAPLGGRR